MKRRARARAPEPVFSCYRFRYDLLRECSFSEDGEEGVAEDGRVNGIPEEGVVGIGTGWMDAVKAWSSDVGEAKVGGVGNDGLKESEYVETANAYALKELLNKEEIVQGLVGCKGGLSGECGMGLGGGDDPDVKEVGNDEVFGSGSSKQELAGGDSES